MKRLLLTYEEMKVALAEMTYYPGWKMSLRVGDKEGIHLTISAELEDNMNPGEKFSFDVETAVPPMVSMRAFELFIDWRLGRIATHESSERLKRNGRPIVNPHRMDADKDIIYE